MKARGLRLWIGLAFGAVSIMVLPAVEPSVADEIFERLDDERRASGAPDWERRIDLDRVATEAAEEVAASDGRGLARPIEAILERLGVHGVHRAVPAVQVLRGYDEPVEVAVNRWSSYAQLWTEMMNPDIDAIGLGAARSSDGSLVLVGVLVTDVVPFDLAKLEMDVARAINRRRAEHDLAALSLMAELSDIARAHSADMATRDYFDHRSPEGKSVDSRMFFASVMFDKVAENISKVEGADDPAAVAVEGWMSSPGHRANILSADYTESGIGIAISSRGALYFTQVFTAGAHVPPNESE